MKIEFLKEALSIAQTKSFQESAEEQFVSQAGLSRHIKSLESSLGVDLFSRSTRNAKLTKAGQIVMPYAKQMVTLYDKMLWEISDVRKESKSALNLAYSSTLRLTGIINKLLHIRSMLPDVSVNLVTAEDGMTVSMILQSKLDCGCVAENQLLDTPRLGRIMIHRDYLVALFPKGHPRAEADSITLEQLRDEKLIMYRANTAVNDLITTSCDELGFRPNVSLYTTIGSDVARLVNAGFGVGIQLSKTALISTDNTIDVKLVRIEPRLDVGFYFVYDEKSRNANLQQLVAFIRSL